MGASRAPACVTPFALPLLLVLAAPWALAQPASDRPDPRPMVTAQPATVKPLLEHSSGSAPTLQLSQAEITTLLRLQIKYVFVIFNENHSFDNEFGTFPGVNGIYSDGQAPRSAANTAGFTQTYPDVNGATVTVTPFLIGPTENSSVVDSVDHSHTGLATKIHLVNNVPQTDQFALDEYTRFASKGGAAYRDIESGGRVQGASTLTMQLARNLFLSPDRSFYRKVQEAHRAGLVKA